MSKKLQSGQISKLLIILAIGFILILIIIFFAYKLIKSKQSTNTNSSSNPAEVVVPEPPKPVYETQVGDIKFNLMSSTDLGKLLKATNASQQNVITTERFIKVTVGAQNKGKIALSPFSWDLGNIVDSDGRTFANANNRAWFFLPSPDMCGVALQPEFQATPCVKIYEVSRASKGLKIEVINSSTKAEAGLLDLTIKP